MAWDGKCVSVTKEDWWVWGFFGETWGGTKFVGTEAWGEAGAFGEEDDVARGFEFLDTEGAEGGVGLKCTIHSPSRIDLGGIPNAGFGGSWA